MLVCKECDSSDIYIMAWIGANDGHFKSDVDIRDNKWCNSCEEHVETKRVEKK